MSAAVFHRFISSGRDLSTAYPIDRRGRTPCEQTEIGKYPIRFIRSFFGTNIESNVVVSFRSQETEMTMPIDLDNIIRRTLKKAARKETRERSENPPAPAWKMALLLLPEIERQQKDNGAKNSRKKPIRRPEPIPAGSKLQDR